jgi:hypothetical protein
MRRMLLTCLSGFAFAPLASATILPPNDLHLQDNLHSRDANIDQALFDSITDEIIDLFQPVVNQHGGKLKANKNWKNSTVNASANKSGNNWVINMYGGLARRSEVSPDGYAMVVCHELGHHLAGFPQKKIFFWGMWAANEGQSDYWASQVCARLLWKDDLVQNESFEASVDASAKASCDSAWGSDADRFLCYRIASASYSITNLLGALNKQGKISFQIPDKKVVRSTNHNHPAAQCRLDTYFSGALCEVEFDVSMIPKDENEQRQQSCFSIDGFDIGTRPRCWFAPAS